MRDISADNQLNLWGKQSDTGGGLEPQRSDLYFVDFTSAQKNVAAAANVKLAPVVPHHVRSISLPELRTKPDPVRRDSVSYNMPSWDDPLDPVKIVFLLDTKAHEDSSSVIRFLDAWLALTRAGRGERAKGYSSDGSWLRLNSDYRVDFQFNVHVWLLRGGGIDAQSPHFQRGVLDSIAKNVKARSAAIQKGPGSWLNKNFRKLELLEPTPETVANAATEAALGKSMYGHSIFVLKRAWLASYKVSDLNYIENSLVTVESNFYADAVELETRQALSGEAKRTDSSS